MKTKIIFTLLLLFSASAFSFAQLVNDYQSIMNTTGDWNNISIWQRWNGSTWVAAIVPPPDGVNISIAWNSSPTISSDVTYSNLTFVPSYITPGSGTITLNANFTIAGTVNINNNTNNAGPIFSTGTGTIIVNSGSTLNINFINAGDFFYPSIVNNGTININSGTSTVYGLCVNGRFSNKGTINCLSHIFCLLPTGSTNDTIAGNVNVSAGATFGLGGSNLGNTIVVSGNISGAGIVDLGSRDGNGNGNVFFTPSSVYNITGITNLNGNTRNTIVFSTGMTITSFGQLISGGAATTFSSSLNLPSFLKLIINGGTINFNTSTTFSYIQLNGATSATQLIANATLYVKDSLIQKGIPTQTGTDISGTDSVIIQPTCIYYGNAYVDGKLVNNGIAYITSGRGSGVFLNNSTTYIQNYISDYYGNFNNKGTLNSAVTFNFIYTMTNSGTVNIQNGTLNYGTLNSSGNVNVSAGATLSGGNINYSYQSLINNGTISGTLKINGNVILSGSGVVSAVSISSNDTLTLGSDHQFGSLTISGVFKLNGKTLSINGYPRPVQNQFATFDASSGIIKFNGTSNQYIGGSPYLGLPSTIKSLIIANPSTVIVDVGLTVTDTLYLNSGTLSITSTLTAPNIQYLGGSISPVPSSANTITINSASATIPATVNNLIITNPSGTTLNNNVFVNSSLDLSGGSLSTGSYTVTLGSSANVTETSSNYILGNLSISRTVGSGQTQTFGNIGFALGNGSDNLGTVTVTRSAGTSGSIVTFNGNSGIKRKWTVSAANQPSSGRTLTLSWASADDNGIVWSPTRKAVVYKSTDGGTTFFQVGNPVDVSGSNPRTISANITSFSIYTIGAEDSPLPVEISSFNSIVNGNTVALNWITVSELNNKGFEIQRCLINEMLDWKEIGFVNGRGNSNNQVLYNFIDKNLQTGNYKYRLKQSDYNGNIKFINLKTDVCIIPPQKYELTQNYPNPFNPVSKINYNIPYEGDVTLKVYDITGSEKAAIVNRKQSAGYYTVEFDGSNLSSGVYFYRIQVKSLNGDYSRTMKMTLIK